MCVSIKLTPNSSVPDCECWYRVLTNKDHVTKDGRVHNQALKSRAFIQSTNRPWAHELSGRLSSLVQNIEKEAQEAAESARRGFVDRGLPVPSKVCFSGVACARAVELRASQDVNLPTDVVYTPLSTDNAHADFVTYATVSDDDLHPVRAWLKGNLRVIRPEDIGASIASCGVIATEASDSVGTGD
jgi:hypothetical protein